MKLTDTECRKAQPKEKRYRLSDENGLSLLVTPSGQKYWNIRFTVIGERKSESSVRNQPTELSKDLLIFTNQAESFSIADLTMNQSIIY